MMQYRIIHKLHELFRQGQEVVISVIVHSSGSTPRKEGSAMLFDSQGRGYFSIGGGIVEKTAMDDALVAFRVKAPVLRIINLDNSVNQCGGAVRLLTTPVTKEDVRVFESLLRDIAIARQRVLDLIIKGGKDSIEVFWRHGTDNLSDSIDNPIEHLKIKVTLPYRLIIFGAGHIAQALFPLAMKAEFNVSVADTRLEYLRGDNFPEAEGLVLLQDIPKGFSRLNIDRSTYVLLCNHTHDLDERLLALALQTEAAFIGMVGSRRKREGIFKRLMAGGIEKDNLERVHCPVGLDIGAQTPFEIALSITAQLILERSKTLCNT